MAQQRCQNAYQNYSGSYILGRIGASYWWHRANMLCNKYQSNWFLPPQFCSEDTCGDLSAFQRPSRARSCFQNDCTCGEMMERGLSAIIFAVSDSQPFRELFTVWRFSRSQLFEVWGSLNGCEYWFESVDIVWYKHDSICRCTKRLEAVCPTTTPHCRRARRKRLCEKLFEVSCMVGRLWWCQGELLTMGRRFGMYTPQSHTFEASIWWHC